MVFARWNKYQSFTKKNFCLFHAFNPFWEKLYQNPVQFFSIIPRGIPLPHSNVLQHYVKREKFKVNDVIFPSGCEACAINLYITNQINHSHKSRSIKIIRWISAILFYAPIHCWPWPSSILCKSLAEPRIVPGIATFCSQVLYATAYLTRGEAKVEIVSSTWELIPVIFHLCVCKHCLLLTPRRSNIYLFIWHS